MLGDKNIPAGIVANERYWSDIGYVDVGDRCQGASLHGQIHWARFEVQSAVSMRQMCGLRTDVVGCGAPQKMINDLAQLGIRGRCGGAHWLAGHSATVQVGDAVRTDRRPGAWFRRCIGVESGLQVANAMPDRFLRWRGQSLGRSARPAEAPNPRRHQSTFEPVPGGCSALILRARTSMTAGKRKKVRESRDFVRSAGALAKPTWHPSVSGTGRPASKLRASDSVRKSGR